MRVRACMGSLLAQVRSVRGAPVVALSRLSAVPTSAKQDVSGFSNLMSDTICSALWLASCALFPALSSTLWLASCALAPASWPRTRARRLICDTRWLATSAPDAREAL